MAFPEHAEELQKALEGWRKWVFRQKVSGYLKNPRTQGVSKGESMSTEILNPVSTPALLYPALHGVRPTGKYFKCPKCGSTNRTRITSVLLKKDDEKVYGFSCDWCRRGGEWFVSSTLILNDILADQIKRVSKFTKETGKEFGALIFRTKRGIVLEMIQVGENREIQMDVTRKLKEDEEILGSFHNHPKSDTFSYFDVGTFLRDRWEQISCVSGAEGTLSVMVKTPETISLKSEELQEWEKKQIEGNTPLPQIAEKYRFLFYEGNPSNLQLVGGNKETISLEKLVERIKGVKELEI